ncbi:MAG: peptide-methionine (S)-S-oxide reductase [Edafosvirus sp.]|uniref:peptide-methionine (S)-S-oxide reductase n=1 Tax=Edafosvirus sp. TaxID=2487765 RepID=A0A3G4ZSH7_9VIRU|nr:MAG: peptide-methionine (S)-S-oxide reductase [Edafosvirus sp.]
MDKSIESKTQLATFGTGCFWCTESIFRILKGVKDVYCGYCGGHTVNPTYKKVCSGTTNHAEVIQLSYDPTEISYDELLQAFWRSHDPTQLNGQGADIGTQYRSVIFYHTEEQKEKAEMYKKKLNDSKLYKSDIVTEISPMTTFYKAEQDHQDYFTKNSEKQYCKLVIKPKLDKFKAIFL